MVDALIFDFDGTLANTKDRQYQWYMFWARMNEIEPFGYFSRYEEIVDTQTKKPNDEEIKQILALLKEDKGVIVPVGNFETFLPVYNKLINFNGAQFVYDAFNLPCDMSDHNHPVWPAFNSFNIRYPAPLFDGIKETIEKLWEITRLPENPRYNKQIRMAINTTNSWKGIRPNLVKYGLLDYFDSHVCSETLKDYDGNGNSKFIHKPSKVAVALSLLLLDANGDDTIFIGDTLADLGACIDVRRTGLGYKTENLITIGCTWGYDGVDGLSQGVKTEHGREYFKHLIDTPQELIGIVNEYLPKDR